MMDELNKAMPGYRDRKMDGRFEPGDLIMGRYKVLAELGQGGMGVVYKCFDETVGIEVALKALPPELSYNSLEMEDIKENFQLVHNLHHPNIASSNNMERNPENGNYYLIMECCEGEDLRRWIKRKRRDNPLTLNDVLPVIQQVADALDYAHAQKILHRDIKPGNIMIDSAGNVKVLDFGFVAQIHISIPPVSMAYHGTSGTAPYMAPEQWRGRTHGAAADQYALAVMAYEMLAGRLPFESTDPAVLREAVLNDTAEEIANLPAAAQNALKRALSKNPADRFNSCADFAAALGGAKVGKAKKVSSGKSGGGAWKWIAAVIVLALIAGGAYFVVKQEKNEERAENERIARERAENERIAREREQQILEKKGELQTLKRKIRSWHLHEGDAESENQWAILEQNENNANSSAYPESKITFLDRALAAANWLIENNKPDTCCSRGLDCAQQKNYTQAVKWFRKAAEQGYAGAQHNLGVCYCNGWGVEMDYYEAVKWFRKAAEQGYASAQCSLGVCYEYGQGVGKDINEAVKWYRKAAEQGNMYAQYNLGECYKNGQGVEKDYYEAVKWFRKAAEQGYASAQNALGVCYDNGQGVEKDLTKTVEWYRKAAEQGYARAQDNLGVCYCNGRGVERDYHEAVKWFRKAAEQGYASAQYNLGVAYGNGHGVGKDINEAVQWFRKAAEQGEMYAQNTLGWCYENGQGVDKNINEAVKWYRKAAEQGDEAAKKSLQRLGY